MTPETETKKCSFCIKDAVGKLGVTTLRESIWWHYCDDLHKALAECERDLHLLETVGKVAAEIPENHEVKLG